MKGALQSGPLQLAVLGTLIAALLLTSFGRVEKNEQGVLLRFGRVVRVLPPGIHPKFPWPADRIVRVATTEVQTVSIGAEPSTLSEAIEEGVALAAPQLRPGQWITGDTNIVELEFAVQYTVADAREYLFAVAHRADRPGDSVGSRSAAGGNADALLRTVAEGVVTALVARRGIDDLLGSGKAELQIAARSDIQRALDELGSGIRLAGVTIKSSAPPTQVIDAFNDVISASNDRERDLSVADSYRRNLLPKKRALANSIEQEARQEADILVNEARGRTQAFLALLHELQQAPPGARRRIWIERVTNLLGGVRTKVYPAGQPFKLNLIE